MKNVWKEQEMMCLKFISGRSRTDKISLQNLERQRVAGYFPVYGHEGGRSRHQLVSCAVATLHK